MNIFSETGDEIQVGDKVRLVWRETHEPFIRGLWRGGFYTVRSTGNFITTEEMGQWALFTKNRVYPLLDRIWEIKSRTLTYRVDQEPQEDEETL